MKIEQDQPVVFDLTEDSCSFHDGNYAQPVQFGDVTQFQLQLENCNNEDNVISEGNFCSTTGYWGIGGRGIVKGSKDDCKISHTAGSAGWVSQTALAVGEYYRIEVSVLEMSAGQIEVYAGYNKVGTIKAAGDYIYYGFCDADNKLRIHFSASAVATITGVSAFHIDLNHKILINDSTGTTLSTLNLKDYIISIPVIGSTGGVFGLPTVAYSQYIIYGDIFSLVDNYLTVKIDWSDLALGEGCYFIGIAKACENTNSQLGIYNGNFTLFDPDFTELSSDWLPLGWTVVESTVTPLDGIGQFDYDYTTGKCTFTGFAGAEFNGTNQWLSSSSATFSKTNSDFAFACVVRFKSLAGGTNVAPISKWDGSTGNQSYRLHVNPSTGKIAASIHDGTSDTGVDSSVTAQVDTNYFCVWVYNSVTNLLKISVNGETFVTVSQSTGAQSVPTDFRIGRYYAGLDWYLDGYVSMVQFYSSISNLESDYQTLYNSGYPLDLDSIQSDLPALYSDIDSYYKLNTTSITADSIGANTLTNNNTVTHYSEYVTMTSQDQAAAISYDTTMVVDTEIGSKIRIEMGSTNGTYRTTDGTFNETLIATAGDIVLRYIADYGITKLVLDSATSVLTNTSDYVSDSQSQLHNIATVHECSRLIHMVNNHNAFGFEFEESTFVPTIRLYGRIRRSQYGGERDSYLDGIGGKKITFARRRKIESLLIEKAPTYVYDFLMLGNYIDHFYVEGTEYIWTDDEPPSITWNQFNSLGTAEIDLEIKTQNKYNINLGTRPDRGVQPPSSDNLLTGASETTGSNVLFADGSTHSINPGG